MSADLQNGAGFAVGNWSGQPSQAPAAATSADQPPVKRYARVPLRTVNEVRAEAARIYRLARRGEMDSAECSRLASVLALIGRMIESSDESKRLDAIEEKLGL